MSYISTGSTRVAAQRTGVAREPLKEGTTIRDHRGDTVRTFKVQGGKKVLVDEQPKVADPAAFVAECEAAGIPADLIADCATARAQGVPMSAVTQAAAQMATSAGGGGFTKYLLWGGLGLAGLLVLRKLRKKGR